MHSASYTVGHT